MSDPIFMASRKYKIESKPMASIYMSATSNRDVAMEIICACATGTTRDRVMLQSLALVSRVFHEVITSHRDDILRRYTVCLGGGPYTSMEQYMLFGSLHNYDDKPAWRGAQSLHWYRHGKPHRDDDKPAVMYADGQRVWLVNGRYHRDGGRPAAIRSNGVMEWWINGNIQYSIKATIVRKQDGTYEYWHNGELIAY